MDEQTNTRLTWQQVIDSYTEYLVEQAEQSISDARMNELGRNRMRLAQLSNLLAVAKETDSIAAVVNWIRYQMGRRETQRAWEQTGLGADIITRIGQMKKEAGTAARRVYGDKPAPEEIRGIHIAMTRSYIGYMRRWFVAKGGQK